MKISYILAAMLAVTGALSVCSLATAGEQPRTTGASHEVKELPPHPDIYDDLIAEQAKRHGVPESLIHRIIVRESRYRPTAMNRIYFGLMQITYATARSMGYKGPPKGLLDAKTNLTYAVPYLANAYMVGGKSEDRAVTLYAAGYYFEARRQHKLDLLRTASSEPVIPEVVVAEVPPTPPPNPISMLFNALAGTPNPAPVGNPNPNPPPLEPTAVATAAADSASANTSDETKAVQASEASSAEASSTPTDRKETGPDKKRDDTKSVAKSTVAKSTIAKSTITKTTIAQSIAAEKTVPKKTVAKKTILASAKPVAPAASLPAPSAQVPSKPELK